MKRQNKKMKSDRFSTKENREWGKDNMWIIKWNNPNNMPIITSAQKKNPNSWFLFPTFTNWKETELKLKIFIPVPIDWPHSSCPGFYIGYLFISVSVLPNCFMISIYPRGNKYSERFKLLRNHKAGIQIQYFWP